MKWCAWQDSNLYAFRHQILSLARLPISPQARRTDERTLSYCTLMSKIKQKILLLTFFKEPVGVKVHEKCNYPIEYLNFDRFLPFMGGYQASQRHICLGADGRGVENGSGTKETRGLSLYEYGYDVSACLRSDERFS